MFLLVFLWKFSLKSQIKQRLDLEGLRSWVRYFCYVKGFCVGPALEVGCIVPGGILLLVEWARVASYLLNIWLQACFVLSGELFSFSPSRPAPETHSKKTLQKKMLSQDIHQNAPLQKHAQHTHS